MATFMAVVLKGDIHVRRDGTSRIKIRMVHKEKPEYFTTDLYIIPDNLVAGHASGKNSAFINSRIKDELDKYTKRYLKLGSAAERMTSKELKARLSMEEEKVEIDLLEFVDDYLQELKDENKDGSARALQGLITNLKGFRKSINFSEVDLNFLEKFQKYLKSSGVKNSVNNYMRYFRLVFNKARDKYNDEDRGILRIPNYPFRKFKIQKSEVKTREHRLSLEELRLFLNYQPASDRESMTKDMFMLMFLLIGINTKDLYFLDKPNSKGRVNYVRAKTGRKYSLLVEPETQEIIDKYKGDKKLINISTRYKSHLDWQKYMNIELKEIGKAITLELQKTDKKAHFPENISTNWARHTWATIARNDCRIDKDDVALCLGHEDTDNRVTDIYINYDYRIIDESNRKVLDALFPPKKEEPVRQRGRKKKTA